MKKLIITTLALAFLIGLTTAVYTAPGAKKVDLQQYDIVEGEENADGWAVINYTPPDKKGTGVAIEVHVWGLLPNHKYIYKTGGVQYASFETNILGKGNCHVNLSKDELVDPGWEINIRDGEDPSRLVLYYQ